MYVYIIQIKIGIVRRSIRGEPNNGETDEIFIRDDVTNYCLHNFVC